MHRGGAEAGWRGGGGSTRVHASCRARRSVPQVFLVRLVYFGSDRGYLRTPCIGTPECPILVRKRPIFPISAVS